MPPGLTIREARVDDVPLILDFIRGIAAYEKLSHQVATNEAMLREALFVERPAAECLLAFLADEPAGFAVFFHHYSTFTGKRGLYLEDLFVEPRHRGRGIGGALLSRVAALAVERDCARMEWSVLDWNEPAIGFYRRLGAVAMNEWTVSRLSGESLRRVAGASQIDPRSD